MPASANRSSQLEIWHQIVQRHHESTDPVRGHLNFIDSRIEELDASGFRWDKDSIRGVLYQIGLPSGPLKKVNEALETRKNSAKTSVITAGQVKKAIETEEASRSRSLSLMPDEIICKIAGHVRSTGCRSEQNLKSFALVNRRFSEICRFWLWENARFPPRVGATMKLWNEEVLPRHGSFVRSIFFTISKGNLDSFLKSLKQSLSLCPNVNSLDINLERLPPDTFDELEDDLEQEVSAAFVKEIETFLVKLIPQISKLKALKHVSLHSGYNNVVMNKFLPQFIKSLPMLESFANDGFITSMGNHARKSSGWDTSKLQHLSSLELRGIPLDDPIWHLKPRPQRIKTLELTYLTNQVPSAEVIHHIAPNLELLTMHEWDLSGTEIGNIALTTGLNSNDRLSLPFLQNLQLMDRSNGLLNCFTDCKALKKLSLLYESVKDFRAIQKLLVASTWPHLESVAIRRDEYSRFDTLDLGAPETQSLKDFCNQSNIRLLLS